MKKTLLTAAVVALLGSASFAQEEGGMKFADGDKNLEFNFAPLGGSPLGLNNGIKLRMFSADAAIRIGVNLGGSSSNTITQDADSDLDLEELKDKESEMMISIRPGYEMHMAGTDRLSPYMGGELDITMKSTKKVEQTQAGEDVVTTTTKNADGYFQLGLNLVAGADWYFSKKVYMGAELGFGFAMQSASKTTVDSDADGFEAPEPTKLNKDNSFNWGPNVNTSLRIGFLF